MRTYVYDEDNNRFSKFYERGQKWDFNPYPTNVENMVSS